MMVGTKDQFAGDLAPCGRQVAGERFQDGDGEGLALDDLWYECGCRRTRHTYHDGSIRVTAVRHDGKVLVDDPGPEHGA